MTDVYKYNLWRVNMAIIFRYKDRAYGYSVVDGDVFNYEVSDDPYQRLCDTDEERAEFDRLFITIEEENTNEL